MTRFQMTDKSKQPDNTAFVELYAVANRFLGKEDWRIFYDKMNTAFSSRHVANTSTGSYQCECGGKNKNTSLQAGPV